MIIIGLDNGIIIKGKNKKGQEFIKSRENSWNEYELGYWRKCWNIRSKFIDDFKYNKEKQIIHFSLEDIDKIIDTLAYFLVKDNWEYEGQTSTVFSWEEEIPSIAQAIKNLYDLKEEIYYMDEKITDADIDFYFYDSY